MPCCLETSSEQRQRDSKNFLRISRNIGKGHERVRGRSLSLVGLVELAYRLTKVQGHMSQDTYQLPHPGTAPVLLASKRTVRLL